MNRALPPEGPDIARWNLDAPSVQKSWRALRRTEILTILKQFAPLVAVYGLIFLWVIFLAPSRYLKFLPVLIPPCVVIAVTLLGVYRKRSNEAAPAELALLDDSGEGESFPVEIAIVQNHFVTGRDRGVLWREGHRLGFHGHQTSFMLTSETTSNPPDYRPYTTHDGRVMRTGQHVPLNYDGRQVSVWIIPLGIGGLPGSKTRLTEAIIDLRNARKTPDPGVFPPLEVQPEERRHYLRSVIAVCLSLPITAALLTLVLDRGYIFDKPALLVLAILAVQIWRIYHFTRWRKLDKAITAGVPRAPGLNLQSPSIQANLEERPSA